MKIKSIISLLLVFTLLFASVVPAFAAAPRADAAAVSSTDEKAAFSLTGFFENLIAKIKAFFAGIKYYFQVKNCCLYWFKNKEEKIARNKISFKYITKIDSSEDKKFILKYQEKNDEI